MKHRRWICGALLIALPLLAQEPETNPDAMEQQPPVEGQRHGGPGGNFRRNPLEQLQDVLTKAGVPLKEEQQKALRNVMEEQRKAFREPRERMQQTPGERPGFSPEMRQRAEEFQGKFLGVLTPEQQEVWKKYQADQVRQRGGYPALRLMLQEAGVPPTSEQEEQIQAAFREYNQQRRSLVQAGSGQADPAQLQELEKQHLLKLSKLLNAEQRRALIESRRKAQQQPAQ